MELGDRWTFAFGHDQDMLGPESFSRWASARNDHAAGSDTSHLELSELVNADPDLLRGKRSYVRDETTDDLCCSAFAPTPGRLWSDP